MVLWCPSGRLREQARTHTWNAVTCGSETARENVKPEAANPSGRTPFNQRRRKIHHPRHLIIPAQALEQTLKRPRANLLRRLCQRGNSAAHQRIPIQIIQGNQSDVFKQTHTQHAQRMSRRQRSDAIGAKQRFRAVTGCV